MWLRMLKLLLDCMLPSCLRFAMLVVMDLRRALGEHMRERACVRVLWVARMRELTGDSGAAGVRHFAGIKEFFMARGARGDIPGNSLGHGFTRTST